MQKAHPTKRGDMTSYPWSVGTVSLSTREHPAAPFFLLAGGGTKSGSDGAVWVCKVGPHCTWRPTALSHVAHALFYHFQWTPKPLCLFGGRGAGVMDLPRALWTCCACFLSESAALCPSPGQLDLVLLHVPGMAHGRGDPKVPMQ